MKRLAALTSVLATAAVTLAAGFGVSEATPAPPARVSCGDPARFPRDLLISVAPDGTKVAFTRSFDHGRTPGEVENVVVIDLVARRERVLGRGEWASWSPDSRELVIVRNESAGYELVRVTVDGSSRSTLSSGPGAVLDVSWSPDGRRVLVVHGTDDDSSLGRLATVAPEGGASTVLAPQARYRTAAWSPDGTAIAVVDGFFMVHVLRADGRLLWSIPLEGEYASATPDVAWAREGWQLAFSATHDPARAYNIYVAAVDKRTVQELPGTTEGYGPAWSPDSRWIAYTVAGKGIGQLYLIHPDGTADHAVPPSHRNDDVLTPLYGWLRGTVGWSGTSTLVFDAFRHESAYRRGFELHSIHTAGRNERRVTYHCQFGSRSSDRALTGTYLADVLRAREGSDRIDPGPGRDIVDAGPGADTLLLKDGERDTVDCGTGADTVFADANDSLRACEHRRH